VSFTRFRLSVVMLAVAGSIVAAPAAHAEDGGWPARESLVPLTDASAERVQVADLVAAAKFGTPAPIDDPAREQVVLNTVRTLSVQMGIDPEVSVAIFADQIEANKQVQRGLYVLWTAHPEQAPTERPDLVKVVRPILDRITTQLLEQIKATPHARVHPSCFGQLIVAWVHVSHDRQLDTLHRSALARALASVCRRQHS
jgi:chorismate mutase